MNSNDNLRIPDAINCSVSREFTQVPNALLRNPEISSKAKTILGLLLSNRDGWKSYMNVISGMMKEGKTAIYSGIKELEKFGYLKRIRYRDKKTKVLKGSFWAYTDTPWEFNTKQQIKVLEDEGLEILNKHVNSRNPDVENPDVENPDVENPDVGFPDVENQAVKIYNSKEHQVEKYQVEKSSSLQDEEDAKASFSTSKFFRQLKKGKKRKPSKIVLIGRKREKYLRGGNRPSNYYESCSKEAQSIFRLWNSLGKPLTKHKDDSKVGIRSLKKVEEFLQDYTPEEIKERIRTYYDLVSRTDTSIKSGIPGHCVSLEEFFGFRKSTKDRIKNSKVDLQIKSWFDECSPEKNPIDKFLAKRHRIPDTHPAITKKFKQEFIKRVRGVGSIDNFDTREEMCFRRASRQLMSFLETNKKILQFDSIIRERGPVYVVPMVFRCLESKLNGDFRKVTPGWLSSQILWKKDFPAYLVNQAIIRRESESAIITPF